jgi:SAM-dependent methyltransferase
MNLKPYQQLAPYYHKEWTPFVLNYLTIIRNLAILPQTTPFSILDIACGTGVLAGELSKLGFSVIGADVSEEMISIAKAEFPSIQFILSDMRTMNLEKLVDLVTCTFDSLNYIISIEQMNKVFMNVNMHLNDDGYFLFDINTPTLYEDKQHGTIHHSINGCDFDQILLYDKDNRISKTIFKFSDGHYEEHIQKPYTYDEIVKIASNTNFKLIKAFRNTKLQPQEPLSYKIFFLMQKAKKNA